MGFARESVILRALASRGFGVPDETIEARS